MTKNEIIEYLNRLQVIEKCASRFSNLIGQYKSDFIQYIYLQLLEMDESKLNSLFKKGELIYYTIAMCRNNAIGLYSPFKKSNSNIPNTQPLDENL